MFRYQPPKSSIWGHLLRKMPTERANNLFTQFLATGVGEYKFCSGRLTVPYTYADLLRRFQNLLSAPGEDGQFQDLSREQCDICIDEMSKLEASTSPGSNVIVLEQTFEITMWKIREENSPTKSLIFVHFGQSPRITTLLQFETVEHFQEIRRVLEEIGLCKLNEKHLKAIRARKK